MNKNYSKAALIDFTRFAAEKALLKANTARTWRIAITQLLEGASETENSDVRLIDLEDLTQRYINRHPHDLKPESLATYKQRLGLAIQEFIKWADDPINYKAKGSAHKNTKPVHKGTDARTSAPSLVSREPDRNHTTNADTVSGLPLPFPVRSDFLAQVVVPRDLTVAEARRIGAFLETVAVDFTATRSGI